MSAVWTRRGRSHTDVDVVTHLTLVEEVGYSDLLSIFLQNPVQHEPRVWQDFIRQRKDLKCLQQAIKNNSKTGYPVNRFTTDSKCLNLYNKTDGQHKMKRLKSRKERNQMRGGSKEALKSKSHHHHCCRQSSKDMTHFHNCCHSSCHCPSRRNTPFPNVVSAAQKPSIITESRLIGHQGLFNHEVKSIDIERLLSEQRKQEKCGQKIQEKNNATSHPSSTSHMPSLFSTNDLLGAGTNEVMPSEMKAHDGCRENEKKIGQGSDLTPGQRPQQQLDLSSRNFKSALSSEQSSLDEVIISNTSPVLSKKGREALLTPTVDRGKMKTLNKKVQGYMVSTLEHTPKNQESPAHQTLARGLSPSPLQLSSSDTADKQHRGQDPDYVSEAVRAVFAGFCDSLQFSPLRRRSLVAESRGVLLKALQERHGPQLQENLLKVQRCLSFGTDPTKKVQEQEPTVIDEDKLLHTVFQANTSSQPHFETQKTTSFKLTKRRHCNWKASPHPQQNLIQTAERLTSPVETPVSLLDDILRPTCSPHFFTDINPSGVAASDHLFAPSTTSCWGEKASASQHWEDRFNRPKSKEAVVFGSFENRFMNFTSAVTERSSRSQYNDSNIQSFFPYQAQLPHRHSAGPMQFPQEQDQFETDRYSFPSSAQIHHLQQDNSLQPSSQFSHSSTYHPLRSDHTDMMYYTSSHMLERDPAPPLSSFLSPEPWPFPPMRLF